MKLIKTVTSKTKALEIEFSKEDNLTEACLNKNIKLLRNELGDSIYPWYTVKSNLVYFYGYVDNFSFDSLDKEDLYSFIKRLTKDYLENELKGEKQ